MYIVKRYSNRKLYDTGRKRYISLDDIAERVRAGEEVRIIDHDRGVDITNIVLFQIVLQEEKRMGGLFPQVLLTRMIRFGTDALDNLKYKLTKATQTNDPLSDINREIDRRLSQLVQTGDISQQERIRLNGLLTSEFNWEVETEKETFDAEELDSTSKLIQQLLNQLDHLEAEVEEIRLRQ